MDKNKKMMAKKEMLQKLSKMMNDEMYDGFSEPLKSKKMSKVTVMSDSPEGLKKGLSKAEQLMEMKFGKKEDMESESSEMEDEACPMCKGEGCKMCEEEEESEEDME